VMFPVYAKAAGIDAGKVQFVPSAPPSLPQLLVSGQVNGIGQFVVGTPLIEAAAKGRKAVVLPYGDFVPELYGNMLVTSKDLASKDPQLVQRFTQALLKGLQYSIEHPDELGQILKKFQPTQNADVATAEMRLMAAFVKPDGFAGPLGALEEPRVARVIQILGDAGAIPAGSLTPGDLASFALAPKS
jgi:NitT/TauT family transport system substrate-binding protein